MEAFDLLKKMITRHESLELFPYVDSEGRLTIGIGRNLDDVGLSKDEAEYLLQNDLNRCVESANKEFTWFKDLDVIRQHVVISMIFNMGINGFKEFKKTIGFIEKRDYRSAAEEMLKSKWAKQVKQRAIELSIMMQTGKYE